MDRDQAPRNVGPDLRSILFDTRYQCMQETGCFACNEFSLVDGEILTILKLSKNFWRALNVMRIFIQAVFPLISHRFGKPATDQGTHNLKSHRI